MRDYNFYVYILASESGTLYIGVSNNLARRLSEHKQGLFRGFTKRYNCHRLIYYEQYNDVKTAIARETQLKNWSRKKKITLIKTLNPRWDDLSAEWR